MKWLSSFPTLSVLKNLKQLLWGKKQLKSTKYIIPKRYTKSKTIALKKKSQTIEKHKNISCKKCT